MSTDPDPQNTFLGVDQNFVDDTPYSNNKLKIMYMGELCLLAPDSPVETPLLGSNDDVTAFTGETGEHEHFSLN